MRYYLLLLLLLSACLGYTQDANDLNFRYKEVTLPELMKKKKSGGNDFIILDVRSRGEYSDTLSGAKHLNIGHIKGAINIPIQELQQKPEALQQLEQYRDKEIYVICSHSYRSRVISKLLVEKNFLHVTNVNGGMSEWFRNYDELKPYANDFYENKMNYSNISPAMVFEKMRKNEPVMLIGFKNHPTYFYDSMLVDYYNLFPDLKDAVYFAASDSAAALAKAKTAGNKTIVTFNVIGNGGGEMASWFADNGIKNVYYMPGNLGGFYEYMVNYQSSVSLKNYFTDRNKIHFYSGLSLCRALNKQSNIQLIDLRHDTLFNKPTVGTKHTYKYLKGAVNFPYYKSADDFAKQFPDKGKEYVILQRQFTVDTDLVKALLAKGYHIGWLIGTNERWEWYVNNVAEFSCKDYFVK